MPPFLTAVTTKLTLRRLPLKLPALIRAGNFKGNLRRVNFVVTAVKKGGIEINHRKSGNYAVVRGFHNSFLHSRDVFARNNPADDLIQKFAAAAPLLRLKPDPYMAVLAAASCLPD